MHINSRKHWERVLAIHQVNCLVVQKVHGYKFAGFLEIIEKHRIHATFQGLQKKNSY